MRLLRASSVLSVSAFQGGHWDLFFVLRRSRYSRGRSTLTPSQMTVRQHWYLRIASTRRGRLRSQRMGSRSTTQRHNELSAEVPFKIGISIQKTQQPKELKDRSTRTFVLKGTGEFESLGMTEGGTPALFGSPSIAVEQPCEGHSRANGFRVHISFRFAMLGVVLSHFLAGMSSLYSHDRELPLRTPLIPLSPAS
jgi:hypothetical protein